MDYIFEPSSEEIVLQLIPKSLKTQLYKAVRDSFASEHGARMTAMHKATDNASELKDELTLITTRHVRPLLPTRSLKLLVAQKLLTTSWFYPIQIRSKQSQ